MYKYNNLRIKIPEFWLLPWHAVLVCFLLGFFLSFLFYMDQKFVILKDTPFILKSLIYFGNL
jgi:hypothetical protein